MNDEVDWLYKEIHELQVALDEARSVAREFAEWIEELTEGRGPREEVYQTHPWLRARADTSEEVGQ